MVKGKLLDYMGWIMFVGADYLKRYYDVVLGII